MADEVEVRKGVVLYCDAGCRQGNPGYSGWGAHGYLYEYKPSPTGTGLPTHLITAEGYVPKIKGQTDNLETVTPLKYLDYFGSSGELLTNNVGEILAVTYALEEIDKHNVVKAAVFTDSEYVRRGLEEGIPVWTKNRWLRSDGKPVLNRSYWVKLLEVVDNLRNKGVVVGINWVKGHSDIHGNIIADLLATLGVVYSTEKIARNSFTTSDPKGYWKKDIIKSELLCYNNLYFNSDNQFNEPGTYYIARPGDDEDQIGKKAPDVCYGVVKLNTPDSVIESIRTRQFETSNGINSIMLLRLKKVYATNVFPYIEEHGGYAMFPKGRGLGMNFLDDNPLTVEQYPPGLVLKAVEHLAIVELLLSRFDSVMANEPNKECIDTQFTVTDVTEHFYAIKSVTNKNSTKITYSLQPTIGNGIKDTILNSNIIVNDTAKLVKFPIVMGLDMPTRNSLKHLEETEPSVFLLTWKDAPKIVKYAIVIVNKEGKGIWSNMFTNSIVVD